MQEIKTKTYTRCMNIKTQHNYQQATDSHYQQIFFLKHATFNLAVTITNIDTSKDEVHNMR